MKRLLVVLTAALVALVAVVIGELALGFASSDRYSTYRGGKGGAKALYLTIEALGAHVVRVHEAPRDAELRGVLFLLADARASERLEGAVVDRLLAWTLEGNTLVVAHEGPSPLVDRLGVEVAWTGKAAPERRYLAPRGDRLAATDGIDAVTVARLGRYTVPSGQHAVLLGSAPDRAAVVLRHGRGRVVLLSDAWLFTNEGLAEPHNLEFALALSSYGAGAAVGFEESIHGFAAERSIMGWLRRRGLGWAVLQGALALGVLAWALRGTRSGAARAAPERGRGSGDYLDAMADIYARAGVSADAARELASGLARAQAAAAGERAAEGAAECDRLVALGTHPRFARGGAAAAALVDYHNRVIAEEDRLAVVLRGGGRKRA